MVESPGKGKGATFSINLPLAPVTAADELHNPKHGLDSKASSFGDSKALDGLRILVVDDEADSRDLIAAILMRYGSEVTCSESVSEALRVFQDWNPDLIVSDIGMPDEDGFSLIKKLRKLKSKRAKQIPVVALTAYATTEERARALTAGFQIHVAKPIEPEALVRSIASAAGRKI